MSRRIRGASVLAVLAALGAMLASGPQAQAATIKGITINPGGFLPGGGDPPYDYIFQVYLDPSFTVETTNFFKIEGHNHQGMVGLTPKDFPNPGDVGSTTSEPNNPPSVIWVPSISAPTNTTFPYAADVTWSFFGNTPISNPNPPTSNIEVYLGEFVVVTAVNFTKGPPIPAGTIIDYSFTVTDSTGHPASGVGTFPLINLGVPEPSSAILLLAGACAVALFLHRARRRRNTA
jgi:hypothetical protein